jgi:hypothetical protein
MKAAPFVLAIMAIFLVSEPAYAYADPGTAGLLYQIVIIIFASLVSYFLFVKDLLRRLFRRNTEEEAKEPEQPD